jgi:hypothetical protein
MVLEHPLSFCRWLEVPTEGPVSALSESFQSRTFQPDLLLRIGPNRLLHAEYVLQAEADTALRMLEYRAQIMKRFPGLEVAQYAIVLGGGRWRSCDDPKNGFRLGEKVVRLFECDPEVLLRDPHLAPLAVLARGDLYERGQALATNLVNANDLPKEDRATLIEA